jgi:methyl-accepting chemotaxis protein
MQVSEEHATANAHRRDHRMNSLGQVVEDLTLVNRNTEQEFLRIGGTLGDVMETVNLISSDLASLASLISGENGNKASCVLTAALDRATEREAGYANDRGGLGGMQAEVNRLRKTLGEYRETVSAFHVIGILTRIEIARLGKVSADFGSLTDDVRSLAENVHAKVHDALDVAAKLIPKIENATRDISVLRKEQLKDLPSLVSEVSASLASFREIQDRVHASSLLLKSRYDAISAAVRKLIVALQFHDITRQQVEHVIEVLGRLQFGEREENSPNSGPVAGPATVLALQSSQLAHAGEKFAASVESLGCNLSHISDQISKIAVESRDLFSGSGNENDSFLLRMEMGCAAILQRMSRIAEVDAVAGVTCGAIGETIARLRQSVEEIRAIEFQMFLVAMNARINAGHLGGVGDPLDVLADAMGQQASRSTQRSHSLTADLDSLWAATAQFSDQIETAAPREGDSGVARADTMQTAIAELHTARERSLDRIPEILACVDRLCENLAGTRAALSAGALFADAIGRARAVIDDVGASSGLPAGGETPETELAEFTVHYTMQSERDVHAGVMAAFTGMTGAGEHGQGEAEQTSEGELSDGVEFF